MSSKKHPILIAIILTGIAFLYVPSIVFAGTDVASGQYIITQAKTAEAEGVYKITNAVQKYSIWGGCDYFSAGNGRSIFIPARTAGEYQSFKNWVTHLNNTDIISFNACVNSQWSGWGACSNTCGAGTQYRTCYNSSPYVGSDCSGLDGGNRSTTCYDYSTCTYSPQYGACPESSSPSNIAPISCLRSDGTVVGAGYCSSGNSKYCAATIAPVGSCIANDTMVDESNITLGGGQSTARSDSSATPVQWEVWLYSDDFNFRYFLNGVIQQGTHQCIAGAQYPTAYADSNGSSQGVHFLTPPAYSIYVEVTEGGGASSSTLIRMIRKQGCNQVAPFFYNDGAWLNPEPVCDSCSHCDDPDVCDSGTSGPDGSGGSGCGRAQSYYCPDSCPNSPVYCEPCGKVDLGTYSGPSGYGQYYRFNNCPSRPTCSGTLQYVPPPPPPVWESPG